MKKRKPWRTFKQPLPRDGHIRFLCLLLLAGELLYLHGRNRLPIPIVEIRQDHEIVLYRAGGGEETKDPDQIYGVRIRLKDGVIDFYRREE